MFNDNNVELSVIQWIESRMQRLEDKTHNTLVGDGESTRNTS
jgi:hypothetical protein